MYTSVYMLCVMLCIRSIYAYPQLRKQIWMCKQQDHTNKVVYLFKNENFNCFFLTSQFHFSRQTSGLSKTLTNIPLEFESRIFVVQRFTIFTNRLEPVRFALYSAGIGSFRRNQVSTGMLPNTKKICWNFAEHLALVFQFQPF